MKQITIIAKDHAGLLADVAEKMAAANVNIESIDSECIGETAVITMAVDQCDDALRALANAGFHAVTEETILVKVADRPGALAQIARRFGEAGINLRSARLIRREGATGIVAISCAEIERARALAKDILL